MPDPISLSIREKVSKWLQGCTAMITLPKRLIDGGTKENLGTRLVVAAQGHKYLTLSHCWGRKQPLVTTRETEEALGNQIPWEALPLSFEDAIRVTRWLGYRYICIDSLCIVQGDSHDWDIESAKMADIYKGCELAVAASRAASCHEGFLEHCAGGGAVLSQDYCGRQLSVFARDCQGHGSRVGRGWCFLERLLAPRVLHFTRHELYLQCRTEDSCEISESGHDADEIDDKRITGGGDEAENIAKRVENDTSSCDSAGVEVAFIAVGQLWSNIVSKHANLNLSYPTDALPALSGIASTIKALYRAGRYFSGIWERYMHYQLAWASNLEDSECFQLVQQGYIAPSFSWGSRLGPVSFPWECHIVSMWRIIEAWTDLKGVGAYG
ncbi:heterokaryon incompatibility protein-domain-containing protein [Echria macrotheca]|uniref:Heterokaryon incompatibility protein-domain-containing protein n=1 Tax=Echria macrotheca TaxID=438768 RepID=A0AAJ0B0W2_9PEZI|nr:heterokaryon incompatibility protein-domain-containing protein [Echria macrotheca]